MRIPVKNIELKQLDSSRMLITRLDHQDLSSIAPAIDAAVSKFGKIDLLLNNAGYGQIGIFEMTPAEKVKEQFDVNLFGVMEVTRAVLPHIRANNGGSIINVSSGAGHWGLPMSSLYSASKFALEGFTESLSYELAPQNISIKLVIPHGGVTATAFNARTQSEVVVDQSLLPVYGPFVQKTMATMTKMGAAAGVSSEDAAKVIYGAATDGTDKLRYFVGSDARGFLKARYQSKDQDEYFSYMRSFF